MACIMYKTHLYVRNTAYHTASTKRPAQSYGVNDLVFYLASCEALQPMGWEGLGSKVFTALANKSLSRILTLHQSS